MLLLPPPPPYTARRDILLHQPEAHQKKSLKFKSFADESLSRTAGTVQQQMQLGHANISIFYNSMFVPVCYLNVVENVLLKLKGEGGRSLGFFAV
jgi:hypothetical protein